MTSPPKKRRKTDHRRPHRCAWCHCVRFGPAQAATVISELLDDRKVRLYEKDPEHPTSKALEALITLAEGAR